MRIPGLKLNVGDSYVDYTQYLPIYLLPIREPIGTVLNPNPKL